MNRNESIIIVAVMTVLLLANVLLNIQTKNLLTSHASEFRQLCQTVAEQNPNTDPVSKAKAIAACSNPPGR